MQTVLITGANGFLAQYLIPLLARNYKVVATSKGSFRSRLEGANVCYLPMDFTDAASVQDVISATLPDVIIHAGALSKPDDCEGDRSGAEQVNTVATATLLKAAEQCSSFFIFLSTDFIFDGVKGMYSEADDPAPVNWYGETKRRAEELVMAYPHSWSIVRTVLVYGNRRGGRHNLLTLVQEKLQKGEPYSVFDDQVRTPTYVEDLAGGIAAIIDQNATGVYHLSGKDVLTPYAMALAAARYLKLDEGLIRRVTAESFPHGAARPKVTGFNIEKAKRELGYQPISFEEGLRKTFGDEGGFPEMNAISS